MLNLKIKNMKKLVKSITVVALLFVVATGMAKEAKLSLTPNAEKSLDFKMDITSEETIISIVDTEGIIIFSEKVVGTKVYSKKFDLKNLPQGRYFLEVEDSVKETSFSFLVGDVAIEIIEKIEQVKPVFKQKEGRVFMNFLNLDEQEVKIKVLDGEGHVVFAESISNEQVIEKVFNFESAFASSYTLFVKKDSDTYSETVLVK
jgi:flagellar hook assembly protein FlgD